MKKIFVAFVIIWLSAGMSLAQIKVACIGNSITAGTAVGGVNNAYPAFLQTLLGRAYSVRNEGITTTTMLKKGDVSYWTSVKMADVFSFKPNIVTIKLGTNDSKPKNWNTHGTEFKRDYLAMIDTLSTLSTHPSVWLILPVPVFFTNYEIIDSNVKKIIVIIKQIAAERNLPLIDANTPLKAFPQYFPDGVHPNVAGEDTIAHIIYRALTKNPVSIKSGSTGASVPAHGHFTVTIRKGVPDLHISVPRGSAFLMATFALYDCKGALVGASQVQGSDPRGGAISCAIGSPGHPVANPGIYFLKMMTIGPSGKTSVVGMTKITLYR
jgi:lysophospholipase L1-like esterase